MVLLRQSRRGRHVRLRPATTCLVSASSFSVCILANDEFAGVEIIVRSTTNSPWLDDAMSTSACCQAPGRRLAEKFYFIAGGPQVSFQIVHG